MDGWWLVAFLVLLNLMLERYPTSIRKKSDPWQSKTFYQRWARRMDAQDRENARNDMSATTGG